MRLYKERQSHFKLRRKNREIHEHLAEQSRAHFRLQKYVVIMTSGVGVVAPPVLLAVFFILIGSKVDGGLSSVPFAVIFSPLWLLGILLAMAFAIALRAKSKENVEITSSSSAWRDQWVYVRNTPCGAFVASVLQNEKRALFHFSIFSLALLLITIALVFSLFVLPPS